MASVTVSASCVVYGNGTNYTVTLPLTNPNPIAVPVQTVTLLVPNTFIIVPTGVINGVWIIPPSGSTIQKTYKGIIADAGFIASGTAAASWAFFPTTSGNSFYITASTSETLTLIWD